MNQRKVIIKPTSKSNHFSVTFDDGGKEKRKFTFDNLIGNGDSFTYAIGEFVDHGVWPRKNNTFRFFDFNETNDNK